jgi:hypothetical protein
VRWQPRPAVPRISYQGQTELNFEDDSYRVESFKMNVPVKKGQQLALRGNITSMVRFSSGGDNTLIYTPPLFPAAPSPRPPTPTAAPRSGHQVIAGRVVTYAGYRRAK